MNVDAPAERQAVETVDRSSPSGGTGVELLRGAAVNTLATFAGVFRTLFLVLVARLLGEAALGSYTLAWATVDLLSKVASLGLGAGITPVIAQRAAAGDRDNCRLLVTAVAIGVATSTVLAIALRLGVDALGGRFTGSPQLAQAVALMAFALPGVIAYRISNGFSRGLRIMRHNVYSRGLGESLVTLAVFLIVVALGARESAPIVAVIAGATVGGLVAFVLAFGASTGQAAIALDEGRRLVRYSLPVAGYGLLNMLIMRLDVLVLGSFVGRAPGLTVATFGAYCAAVEIANMVRRIRQAFEPIYMPVVAGHMAGDGSQARQVVAQMSRWTLALVLPVAGTLVLSGGVVLALLGSGFEQAASWLAMLVIAQGLYSLFGLAEALLLVRRPMLNLLNSSVAVVAQIGLSLLLIPRVGAMGAAVAVLGAHGVLSMLRLVELRWLMRWSWPWQALGRPVSIFAAALVAGVAVRALVAGLPGMVSGGIVLLTISVVGWKVVGLDGDDRATLDELRRRWRERAPAAPA